MKEFNKKDWRLLVEMFVTPVLLVLLGIILILSPDSATVMVTKVMGWILVAIGASFGFAGAITKRGLFFKILTCFACVFLGGFLLRNPLALAAGLGRAAGLFLLVRGAQDTVDAFRWHHGLPMAVVTILVGVVLIALPLTTSRLVMMLLGGVVLFMGVAVFADRIGMRRHLQEPDDGNIVDAL